MKARSPDPFLRRRNGNVTPDVGIVGLHGHTLGHSQVSYDRFGSLRQEAHSL